MTGWICEKRREENPAMVVIIEKKVGVILESIVSSTVRLSDAFG